MTKTTYMTIGAVLIAWTLMFVAFALPVAAVPYTDLELEDYMKAIYCEPVWAMAFDEYRVQFIDADLDGRMELITMEAGEDYAPKNAEVYDFMDAELSGRGAITVGKLEVCRDPETNESFMVSRIQENGQIRCQRLVYDHEAELILLEDVPQDRAARLQDCGYRPIVVTNADRETINVYEDCRAIFLPAYQNTVCTSDPPVAQPENTTTQTTVTENTAPQNTVSQNTVPQNTAIQTTTTGGTVSENTVTQPVATQTAPAKHTTSENTVTENTIPENMVPESEMQPASQGTLLWVLLAVAAAMTVATVRWLMVRRRSK